MRLTLLTASILLGAAGAASAQAVPVPAVPPAPPAAPVVFPPGAGRHAGDVHVNVDVDRLVALADHGQWAADHALQSLNIDHALQSINYAFAEQTNFGPFKQSSSQVDALYSQARNSIDNNQYDRALSPLDRVIAAKGERADGAMYWKAYTLYKLARRDEAVATVNQLAKDFPQSPWVRDARALEVEMKQSAGQAVGTDATDDDVKLLAMQAIMRSNPEAAFPVIEKMLAGSGNVRLKDRALFVLSQNRTDRARNILGNVARSNANPDLQRAAIRYLGQSNSPESVAVLTTLYRADQPIEVRRSIISSLRQSGNNTAATNALVTIARTERDSDLRMQILRQLSGSNSPEVQQLMLEIIQK